MTHGVTDRVTHGVTGALREVVDLLLPARCVGCSSRIPSGGRPGDSAPPLVCEACRGRLREAAWPRCPRCHLPVGTGRRPEPDCLSCRAWPEALAHARWSVSLEAPADALVHGLKYEGWRDLAPFMASRMAGLELPPRPDGTAADVVVPVPTTRRRERARGYNQARLLAADYAALRGIPLVEALERRDGGGTQVALHPDERRANVEEAFRLRPAAAGAVAGCRALVVDDVLTTGATAGAAARVLERAGAKGVVIVTFARSLPGRSSRE